MIFKRPVFWLNRFCFVLINKEEKRFLKVKKEQVRHKNLLVLAHVGASGDGVGRFT